MTEDQIRVLEARSIKFMQCEQITGKKALQTKELTLVSSESHKERRECGARKYSKK